MNRVAEKSNGMSEIAAQEFGGHQDEGGQQGRREKSVSGAMRMAVGAVVVHVHR